jgi:very-short-patch-repair endonuclease
MTTPSEFAEVIAQTIATAKAYNVPKLCVELGLAPGDEADAFRSKRLYVLERINLWQLPQLAALAERVLKHFDTPSLREALSKYRDSTSRTISVITRRRILEFLEQRGNLGGRRDLVEMLSEVWPLASMPSTDFRVGSAAGDIAQHMINNDDWSYSYLFDYLELKTCSQQRFFDFLGQCVHPLSVEGDEQKALVEALNAYLRVDGFHLEVSEAVSGYSIYSVKSRLAGVSGSPKNLIFASDGPKPDIVLADAINNDVRIVRHQEHCLIFERPIPDSGLTWLELVRWWDESPQAVVDGTGEHALFRRLRRSLASEPEKRLFTQYFRRWRTTLGDSLPALLPQVYLHYDPLAMKARASGAVLPRQRMDFLMLLSSQERIVIELDGKQHYAVEDMASPVRYAQMVAADRDLRLVGYEVYRFGGFELMADGWRTRVDEFYARLLTKHSCLP